MSLFESTLSKLTLKELGTHLRNYADLYANPIKVWKKIISNRNESYNLLILHLIYYCIFIFFIVKEITLAIPIVILEAAITIIPLLLFLIPFLFFVKVFKKQYKLTKLFRLFLIIKLQFIPIFILSYLLVDYLRIENLYLLTDNLIGIIWLAFMIIFPSIINMKFWRKLIWIFSNYVFFLLGISIIAFTFDKIDGSGKIFEKLSIASPNTEYSNFEVKELYSPFLFIDSLYFVHIKAKNDTTLHVYKTQFVSFALSKSFLQSKINKLNSDIQLLDSLAVLHNKKYNDTIPIHSKNVSSISKIDRELTLPYLDTLKLELDKKFNLLLAESKKLKDSAKFESNRHYFSVLSNYLEMYQNSYIDKVEISKIVHTSAIDGTVKFDKENWGTMFKVDSNYYNITKNQLQKIELSFARRSSKATFIFNILFYPEEFVLDKLGYFD